MNGGGSKWFPNIHFLFLRQGSNALFPNVLAILGESVVWHVVDISQQDENDSYR